MRTPTSFIASFFVVSTLALMAPPALADELPDPPKDKTSKCAGGDASDLGLWFGLAAIAGRIATRKKDDQA